MLSVILNQIQQPNSEVTALSDELQINNFTSRALSDQVQMNTSAITTLTESTDVAIRILEQKLNDDIAGMENKVSLALIEIEKTVGNEKDDMKSKVAVVNLLSNRIYQLESYAQTNRSHIYPAQDKMEGLGGQVQAM